MLSSLFSIFLILFFPYLAKKIHTTILPSLSPVVLCYLMGILMANLSFFPINTSLMEYCTQATILLAIPFLLYATDLSQWILDFKSMTIAFLLCVLSGIVGTTIAGVYFSDTMPDTWRLAGMLAAIFSGGIPNMQAVGIALEAENDTIILMNAADIFVGGLYLIFLTSVAPKFLSFFFKKHIERKFSMSKITNKKSKKNSISHFFKGLILSILIILTSVGISKVLFGNLVAAVVILSLTTLSIIASQMTFVKQLKGTFEVGDYLLLMFCVALGMQANFDNILENGIEIIIFMAFAWLITVLLHWLLCYFLKIDRDTVLIANTAAIYGPVFIGQIASTLKNRHLIFPGIALGLLGMAMGNYIGILVAWGLKYLEYI